MVQGGRRGGKPGPLSTNYWNGGYYGLPDDTNTQVFFYNKADFAAANLAPPTTWNQMIADAKLLTIPSKGQHGLGVDSTDIWNVVLRMDRGGSFTNKKLTQATGYMNGGDGHATPLDTCQPLQRRGHRQ